MDGNRTARGRFADGNKAASVRKKAAPGSIGVRAYGGIIDDGERDRDLIGAKKWLTYSQCFKRPPIAIAALLRYALHSGAKWSLHENPAGGAAARKGVEIVQQGLLDARLESGDTWQEVVAKANMSWFNGSSLHAVAIGRRKDGMVVCTDIAHRPMHTIERWLPNVARPDNVVQRQPDGTTLPIKLNECLYLVERMLSDSPFGVGTLNLAWQRIKRVGNYEALEGSELFSSLGGLPIARVPMEEIKDSVKHLPDDKQEAAVNAALAVIEQVVKDRIKTPEKQLFLTLDSATFKGVDPNTITVIQKWAIEIVKADLQGLVEVRTVITDLDLDLARMHGVEFVFVGGGDSAGTFGMHESKVGLFQSTLQTGLDRTAIRARDQVARRLIAANGLDPDTATPTLVPEKITITAVLDAVAALEGISRAGLHPKDPARNIIRERVELPPEPDEVIEDMMAPREPLPPDDVENIDDVAPLDDEQVDDAKKEPDPKVDEKPVAKTWLARDPITRKLIRVRAL